MPHHLPPASSDSGHFLAIVWKRPGRFSLVPDELNFKTKTLNKNLFSKRSAGCKSRLGVGRREAEQGRVGGGCHMTRRCALMEGAKEAIRRPRGCFLSVSSSQPVRFSRFHLVIAGSHIQHTAISGVASNFQHVKICWRVDDGSMIPPPHPTSSSTPWWVDLAEPHRYALRRKETIALCCACAPNAGGCLSCSANKPPPVSRLCRPPRSINNSSLDVNIVIPHGAKTSFFRTKGECARWLGWTGWGWGGGRDE